MLDTAIGYLSAAADAQSSDAEAAQLIIDAELLGSQAYQSLKELDGADADQIPHQIVGPFQRWVDGLGIKNTIFFRADHVANYELARFHLYDSLKHLNDPAPSLTAALQAVEWPFMRLTVPSQALGMLPHFAIVGHELGHAIQDRIDLDASLVDSAVGYAALDALLAAEGMKATTETDLELDEVFSAWAREFTSDAVGLLIAGPAFFFALGGFFEISGGYGISPSHPPSAMRRRLVLARLRAGTPNHADVFERITGLRIEEDTNSPNVPNLPADDVLYADLRIKHGAETAAVCVALLSIAEDIANALYDEAEVVLRRDNPLMLYTPDHLEADLSYYLEPLCDLIPAIERPGENAVEAASLACNLNVGWAALLSRLDRIRGSGGPVGRGDPDTPKMEKLHELLLKGVELAEARMMWDEIP
jgi:hypothetical protein